MAADGFQSAFTGGGLVSQLAFLLLVIGVLSSRYKVARAFISVAALIGLCHALWWTGNAVAAFWWGLLMIASLLVLGRRLAENARTRFTAEEEAMLSGMLSALAPSRARHLLDQGFWLSGRAGDVLTREDEAVTHLYYLSSGEARVISHGKEVGMCGPGDLVGEVTVLSGDRASATVVLAGPARFWCAPAKVLRPYLAAHDDVRHALEQGFAVALKAKLRASNERIARGGNIAA